MSLPCPNCGGQLGHNPVERRTFEVDVKCKDCNAVTSMLNHNGMIFMERSTLKPVSWADIIRSVKPDPQFEKLSKLVTSTLRELRIQE
ncbi:MAG: hypothetical protein J0I12_11060 [Candidatus Eremiobacteraeota bacterium]|nr:hypothetical protein [Candidatus Eremiobacteraeota bacterium]